MPFETGPDTADILGEAWRELKEEEPDHLAELIEGMAVQMDRIPTEDEVLEFIFGTREQREAVLKGE